MVLAACVPCSLASALSIDIELLGKKSWTGHVCVAQDVCRSGLVDSLT